MTTTETAVVRQQTGPGALVQTYKQDFADVLPTHVRPDTWVRLATGLLRRDKNLAALAQSNPGSLMQALLECARLGHEPGTKDFYLVPMGREIEGWESYRGLIDRMFRAGGVTSVKVEVVREHDHFEYRPAEQDRPDHRPDWFGDRGAIVGAYAYAELTGGGTSKVVVINRDYIAKVKQQSRGSSSASSPWVKWEEAMVLKTAVKRLEAFVPTSTEYRDAQAKAAAERQATTTEAEVEDRPALPVHDPVTGEVPREEVFEATVVEDPPAEPDWPDAAQPPS